MIGNLLQIKKICFFDNDKKLISGHSNELIIIWSIETCLKVQSLEAHKE